METIETMQDNLTEIYQKMVKQILQEEEKIFTKSLRHFAEPPIKGEITRGKIIWRGIKLVRQRTMTDYTSWLEQRGKQISPKVTANFVNKNREV